MACTFSIMHKVHIEEKLRKKKNTKVKKKKRKKLREEGGEIKDVCLFLIGILSIKIFFDIVFPPSFLILNFHEKKQCRNQRKITSVSQLKMIYNILREFL